MKSAMYLAGHGSLSRPRLIELQHRRIMRYREVVGRRYESEHSAPTVFLDLRLPRFGMGQVDLQEVPGFLQLYERVQKREYDTVYIDVDETRPGLTPDHESGFIRFFLEKAGGKVWNVFTDDDGAFEQVLGQRCGKGSRFEEVTDASDIVCFFPSLTSEIVATAFRRELGDPEDEHLRPITRRIDVLRSQRPYSGGGRPFIEDRLSAEWQLRIRKSVWPTGSPTT